MTVVTTSMAFPGAPFPQHGSGQTTTVQSYVYPGAVQPKSTGPVVTSYTMAFPNAAFPQHLAGQTTIVQAFWFPGAVQPIVSAAPPPVNGIIYPYWVEDRAPIVVGMVAHAVVAFNRNLTMTRRRALSFFGWNKSQ